MDAMQPMGLSPREILDHLVGFRSISSASNLDLIDWVEGDLASHGVASTRVYSADGTKASLFANAGPLVPGSVILSGHFGFGFRVVPAESEQGRAFMPRLVADLAA